MHTKDDAIALNIYHSVSYASVAASFRMMRGDSSWETGDLPAVDCPSLLPGYSSSALHEEAPGFPGNEHIPEKRPP